ncbi:MAG: site-specific integrase [Clostridia bacterium]|nr:site-specific integrase [Clostridia bacterium]MBR6509435.1 site-specific integrase [Clostridia bacterium]
MLCRKCKKEIPESSLYCNFCGAKQTTKTTAAKSRGNGQGCVYKNKRGLWVAEITRGYDTQTLPNGNIKLLRRKATKSGFSTKRAALEYLPYLKQTITTTDLNIKFKDLYEKWLQLHEQKVTHDTINCYKAAFKYFSPLYYVEISKIKTEHLQKCVDACPKKRQTKKNMKSLCTALWKYATQLDIVDRNYAEFIYIAPEEKTEKNAFSKKELQLMWDKVDIFPNLKYVLILCYTGMRIGEMLNAKTSNYNLEENYFITGSKTEAGKDRIITISPRLLPFFENFGKSEYLFFEEAQKPSDKKFRYDIYYPALSAIGLDIIEEDGSHRYNPHCCRHTFATMMKNVDAPATDKQKLIGHSKFEMTAYYTHTDIESLRQITNNL